MLAHIRRVSSAIAADITLQRLGTRMCSHVSSWLHVSFHGLLGRVPAVLKASLLLNLLGHCLHWNGFSFV